jgi:phage-related protein
MANLPTESPLSAAAEEALFQRLLRRLTDVGQVVAAGAGSAAGAVAEVAGSAASGVRSAAGTVGEAASDAAGQIAGRARDAAEFVQRYPGVLALGAIGPAAPAALLAITALTAKKIIENRRSGDEPVAQMLFRVPESLRDEVKRLAVDEKRQMDELLTEGVLDLLIKYGRQPKALQNADVQPA